MRTDIFHTEKKLSHVREKMDSSIFSPEFFNRQFQTLNADCRAYQLCSNLRGNNNNVMAPVKDARAAYYRLALGRPCLERILSRAMIMTGALKNCH